MQVCVILLDCYYLLLVHTQKEIDTHFSSAFLRLTKKSQYKLLIKIEYEIVIKSYVPICVFLQVAGMNSPNYVET